MGAWFVVWVGWVAHPAGSWALRWRSGSRSVVRAAKGRTGMRSVTKHTESAEIAGTGTATAIDSYSEGCCVSVCGSRLHDEVRHGRERNLRRGLERNNITDHAQQLGFRCPPLPLHAQDRRK